MIMTKKKKAVLMHSPATGQWFYIGTRACYCGVLNSSSKSSKKFLSTRLCAFTLAHAMCSWCQISGTTEARTNVMTWKTSGRTQLHRAPRDGQARGALALPHCCPMAPKGQHSSRCHPKQALLHPQQDRSVGGEFGEWSSEEAFLSLGTKWLGRGKLDPATPPRAPSCASPPGHCTRASRIPGSICLPSHIRDGST